MGVSEPEKGNNKAWVSSGKVFLETESERTREKDLDFILLPTYLISSKTHKGKT